MLIVSAVALGPLCGKVGLLPGSRAAAPNTRTLDAAGLLAAIDHIRTRQTFDGSVLVLKDGHTLAARSYGYADRARHRRATLDTRYRISDLTRAFTWIGLLQLRDAHRLDLDRSVCLYLRECPSAWRALTPRHLMGPSSGLRPLGRSDFAHWPPTLSEYVDRLRTESLFFKPGALVAHNTSPYFPGASPEVLAADVLEAVSGESWADYVRRHILRPAGMTSTGFERSPRDAVGYGRDRSRRIVARPLPAPGILPPVDLGLWSTVRDFARLDRELRSGKLLSEESQVELDTPVLARDRRRGRGGACCWLSIPQFGHAAEMVGAHGFGDGFYAVFERFPKDGVLVLVFTNFGGNEPAFSVGTLAASVALGEYPGSVAADIVSLSQLAGVYESRPPGGRMNVVALRVQQGKLRVTKAFYPPLLGPLVPRSDSTFIEAYAPALQFEFSRDQNGLGTGLLVRDVNFGWRMQFRRVSG